MQFSVECFTSHGCGHVANSNGRGGAAPVVRQGRELPAGAARLALSYTRSERSGKDIPSIAYALDQAISSTKSHNHRWIDVSKPNCKFESLPKALLNRMFVPHDQNGQEKIYL